MPLPWKRSKSGRISRFVSDIQQSPKPGGSLVVETGFPTSLIDIFVKNRDRIKKSSSKRINKTQTPINHSHSSRRLPPLPLQRRTSLPTKLDPASVTDDPSVNKIDEGFFRGLTAEYPHDGDVNNGRRSCGGGGGECVLMVGVFKVFVVVVLALSTKKLAVGITLSAFALLFLELAVARVFNLCPGTQTRLDSLIEKLIGKQRQEMPEESSATHDIRNNFSFEIVEESSEQSRVPQSEKKILDGEDSWETLDKAKPEEEEDKQVQTIRDVVFKLEKSKSSKLKSKIVKKIVPKKLRSYKKKKKMKIKEKEGNVEVVEEEEEEEEEESVSEVSSLSSDEISERDDVSPNPPLLESCEEERAGSKRDLTKAIVMIVIALAGLLNGKVLAIGLTLCCCLIPRVFCCKSQTRQTLNTIRGSGGAHDSPLVN